MASESQQNDRRTGPRRGMGKKYELAEATNIDIILKTDKYRGVGEKCELAEATNIDNTENRLCDRIGRRFYIKR